MKNLPAIGLSLILLCGCGNSAPVSDNADSSIGLNDSVRTNTERADINQTCCFTSPEEFLQFLPDTIESFFSVEDHPLILCPGDTALHSTTTRIYSDESGHQIAVAIVDFCNTQTDVDLWYSTNRAGANAFSEFNEFDIPESHYGLCYYDSKTKGAVVLVIVDNRFGIEIFDAKTSNSKTVLMFYGHLPLKELAGFKK